MRRGVVRRGVGGGVRACFPISVLLHFAILRIVTEMRDIKRESVSCIHYSLCFKVIYSTGM